MSFASAGVFENRRDLRQSQGLSAHVVERSIRLHGLVGQDDNWQVGSDRPKLMRDKSSLRHVQEDYATAARVGLQGCDRLAATTLRHALIPRLGNEHGGHLAVHRVIDDE